MATWPRFREPDLSWANLELDHPSDRDAYFDRGRTNATRRRFVILDEIGEIIGTIGLRALDFGSGEGTLGIIIRADAVGKGYGTDAVRALVRFAFDVLDLRRVFLDVAESNRRARRVYDKLGFVPVGDHVGPNQVVYVDMVLERNTFRRLQAGPRDSARARNGPAVR
jgi:RimJ/RimL family protein N-acetyltransferase